MNRAKANGKHRIPRELKQAQQIVRAPAIEEVPIQVGDWLLLAEEAPPNLAGQVRKVRSITMAATERLQPYRKWIHLHPSGSVDPAQVLRFATETEIPLGDRLRR